MSGRFLVSNHPSNSNERRTWTPVDFTCFNAKQDWLRFSFASLSCTAQTPVISASLSLEIGLDLEHLFFGTIKRGLIGCSGRSSSLPSKWIIPSVSPKNREAGSPRLDDPPPGFIFLALGPRSIRLRIADPVSVRSRTSQSCLRHPLESTKLQLRRAGGASQHLRERGQTLLKNSNLTWMSHGAGVAQRKASGERDTAAWDPVTWQRDNDRGSPIAPMHRPVPMCSFQTQAFPF